MTALMKELSSADFQKETAKGLTLVDYWAEWCGPCRMQAPILERVASRMAGKVGIAKVNVDHEPGLAQEAGVSGIPTLVLYKDGEPLGQMVGVQNEETLVHVLEKAAAGEL